MKACHGNGEKWFSYFSHYYSNYSKVGCIFPIQQKGDRHEMIAIFLDQ
jgi:hypothetical protein